MFAGHSVLSVQELNNDLTAGSYSTIVLNHHILEGLHQSARNVASIGRLNRSINKTFTTAHSVEIEFRGRKTSQVAVTDETFGLSTVIILGKVRQRALVETESDTLTLDVLLTTTRHNLRDIVCVTFRARFDHVNETVILVEIIKSDITRDISSLVKPLVDLMLEGLHGTLTRLRLQTSILGPVDDLADLSLTQINGIDNLFVNLRLNNDISDTDGETCVYNPVVDHELDVREKIRALLWTQILPCDVDQATR